MESPEQQELEKFIHEQLQKLPEHEAPEDLTSNVMAAILARRHLPWWKQPFTEWPPRIQSVLFILLAAGFSVAAWLAAKPADAVSVDALAAHASSWSGLLKLAGSWAGEALVVLRGLSWPWFAGLIALFCLMYGACVAAGMALYRVTANAGSRTA